MTKIDLNNMQVAGHSQTGLRHQDNQDRYLIRSMESGGLLLAVADGMGGEPAGDVAAQEAIDAMALIGRQSDALDKGALVSAISDVCQKIYRQVEGLPELEGCGTTLTVVYHDHRQAVWAHVGDSRFYILRDGRLTQVTRDHTAAAFMVEEQMITPEEAVDHPSRHMLMDCVGCGECVPDSGGTALQKGDILFLASDGFYDRLAEAEIVEGLTDAEDLEAALARLAEKAVTAGSKDDITAVVCVVGESGGSLGEAGVC